MSLLFHPDGRRLISGGRHEKGIRVWDVLSGECLLQIELTSGYFEAFALSPDGRTLVSGTMERIYWSDNETFREQKGAFNVQLWELGTGRLIRTLHERVWDGVSKDEGAGITSLGFTPDGVSIYAVGRYQPLRIWSAESGCVLLTQPTSGDGDEVAGCSLDGRILATAGADPHIRLFELPGGKPIAVLKSHAEQVTSLLFSPSGKLLASGSADKSVVLWDVASRKPSVRCEGHSGRVTGLAFSKDGKTLATGGSEDLIRFWDVSSGRNITRSTGHPRCLSGLTGPFDIGIRAPSRRSRSSPRPPFRPGPQHSRLMVKGWRSQANTRRTGANPRSRFVFWMPTPDAASVNCLRRTRRTP
jgi:WD40 repeat protein